MHKDLYRKVAGLILFWGHRIQNVHDENTITSIQRNSKPYYSYLSHRIEGIQSGAYRFDTDHIKESVLTVLQEELEKRFKDLENGKVLDRKNRRSFDKPK